MDPHSPEIVYNMTNNCPLITDLKEATGRDTGLMCMCVVSKLLSHTRQRGGVGGERGKKVKTPAPDVEGQGG